MLKKIILVGLGLLVGLLAVLAVLIAMQPNEYSVVRSATIAAPPATVFEQVNDFHKWKAWSPWEKRDPNIKTTFSGAEAGKGAIYQWTGNDDVGEGEMTILESRPSELVKIDLHFIRPFEDRSITEFEFQPSGEGTAVTWSMAGKHNLMSKAMCLIMDMDQMIGPDFEKGLATMKTAAEEDSPERGERE